MSKRGRMSKRDRKRIARTNPSVTAKTYALMSEIRTYAARMGEPNIDDFISACNYFDMTNNLTPRMMSARNSGIDVTGRVESKWKRGFGNTVAGFRLHDRSYAPMACDWCGKVQISKLMSCGRCKMVSYCNKQCQTLHWTMHHKTSCATLRPLLIEIENASDEQHFMKLLRRIFDIRLSPIPALRGLQVDPYYKTAILCEQSMLVGDLCISVVQMYKFDVLQKHMDAVSTLVHAYTLNAFEMESNVMFDGMWGIFECIGISSRIRQRSIEFELLYLLAARLWERITRGHPEINLTVMAGLDGPIIGSQVTKR